MNKILSYAAAMLMGAGVLASCADDRDSNPVLDVSNASFELYTPLYNNEVIDLVNSESFDLAWSEPEVAFAANGKPAPIALKGGNFYSVQVSLNNFQDVDEDGNPVVSYTELSEQTNLCKLSVSTLGLNKALATLGEWKSAEDYPELATVYLRVVGVFEGENNKIIPGYTLTSNVQQILVHPSYIIEEPAPVEFWYLVGNCIGDGSWGDQLGVSAVKMLPVKGETYDFATGKGTIEWIGYVNDGFKLRGDLTDGWASQWGQGASFGEFAKNDGGSGNIQPATEGYYRVTLNTLTDELKVEAYDGVIEFADGIAISGDLNGWGDTPMNPVNTKVAATQNHDWYYDYTVSNPDGEVFKFKMVGSWDTNWGGVSAISGWGENNGENIWVPAGSYRIFFNDITGYYEIVTK